MTPKIGTTKQCINDDGYESLCGCQESLTGRSAARAFEETRLCGECGGGARQLWEVHDRLGLLLDNSALLLENFYAPQFRELHILVEFRQLHNARNMQNQHATFTTHSFKGFWPSCSNRNTAMWTLLNHGRPSRNGLGSGEWTWVLLPAAD